MNPSKYINQGTKRVMAALLPDICTIKTAGAPTKTPAGNVTNTEVSRLYAGSPNIPCRVDSSRAFRPERFPNQEINANEYILHLPKEVVPLPNDTITIKGHKFEIRKLGSLPEWRLTNEMIIVALEGQYAP